MFLRARSKPQTQFACKYSVVGLPAANLLVNILFGGRLEINLLVHTMVVVLSGIDVLDMLGMYVMPKFPPLYWQNINSHLQQHVRFTPETSILRSVFAREFQGAQYC